MTDANLIRVETYFATVNKTVRSVLPQMDLCQGLLLLVDAKHRLIGTLSDGDVRRALIAGLSVDDSLQAVLSHKEKADISNTPVTLSENASREEMLSVLVSERLLHLPLLNDDRKPVSVVRLEDLVEQSNTYVNAMVMAGGRGERLRPLTDDTPKPMLPFGGRPVMEHLVNQISGSGIKKLFITTHYKPEVIQSHFGNGDKFGLDITYLHEESQLGTGGALADFQDRHNQLLVVNADIVTEVDFRAILSFHREHNADVTVAVRRHEQQVPFGVVEADGWRITAIKEKPSLPLLINAGIYVLESKILSLVPSNEAYDMPQIINAAEAKGYLVAAFIVHEFWADIGTIEDYNRATAEVITDSES